MADLSMGHNPRSQADPSVSRVVTLTVSPHHRTKTGTFYSGTIDGVEVVRSKRPHQDAARLLIELGWSPDAVIEMMHGGSHIVALREPLGKAAGRFTLDNDSAGLRTVQRTENHGRNWAAFLDRLTGHTALDRRPAVGGVDLHPGNLSERPETVAVTAA